MLVHRAILEEIESKVQIAGARPPLLPVSRACT